jgi:hypothetical protein
MMAQRRLTVSAMLDDDDLTAGLPGNTEQALAETGHV